MMESWSDEQSPGRAEPLRKDAPMFELSPTASEVTYLRVQDDLARAERYHALTRTEGVAEKAGAQSVIRLPRVSLVRRLGHLLPRPA